MICYYTRVNVSNEFNQDILISMFFDWLNNTSKNRMEGIHYNKEKSYQYINDNKIIKIENFNDFNSLGIQFELNDYYRKSNFKVEVIYNYENNVLGLGFYKEINEESEFIEKISIPGIFKDLLKSSYIEKDNGLNISLKPLFIQSREYHEIKKINHTLPLIILTRNKRCIVDPNKLNDKVFGIGHVLCVLSKNKDLEAKIIYPDGFIEIVDNNKQHLMQKTIREKVRVYMIEESHQYYSFDDLMKLKLHKEHQIKEEENRELKSGFLQEIIELKDEILMLQEEYELRKEEYNKLKKENELLENKLLLDEKESILILKEKDNDNYRKLVINTLSRYAKGLPLEDNFRKRDILNSILENQE